MHNHLLIAGVLVSSLAGFAASTANAGSPPTPPGTDYVVPVERPNEASRSEAGDLAYWYSNNSRAALGPDHGPESFWRRPQGAGGDEISELQSMFPSASWPPSMRD
jgi:hypothetical protein